MNTRTLKAAFPLTLPVMAGYLVLGMGFGILLESKGYSLPWALLMSVLIYAGSMQYVAIDLLSGGVSLLYGAFMTVMINARHLFYGLSLIEKYKSTGKKKALLIFGLTDETYSLICSAEPPEGIDRGWFFLCISLLDHLYWMIGSAAGSLVGSMLAFNTAGIDFAMTALFVVILTDQWLNSRQHAPAVIGLLSSFACLMIFGPSNFILPSMAVIFLLLIGLRKKLDKEDTARANEPY